MAENDDLRAQLDDVDAQLQTLRAEYSELTAPEDGPRDSEDVAAALTNAEETGALIETLQQRRDTLAAKLEGNG